MKTFKLRKVAAALFVSLTMAFNLLPVNLLAEDELPEEPEIMEVTETEEQETELPPVEETPAAAEEMGDSGSPDETVPAAELILPEEEPETEEVPAEAEPTEVAGEVPADAAAAEVQEAAPVAEEVTVVPVTVGYKAELTEVLVTAQTAEDAFSEEVRLVAVMLSADSAEYKKAEEVLEENEQVYDGMLAFDIHFESVATGQELEPTGTVLVNITAKPQALAEIAPAEIDVESVQVTHIKETPEENKIPEAEVVADSSASTADVKVEMSAEAVEEISTQFEVESFSTFTITWTNAETGDEESATIHWGTYEGDDFKDLSTATTVDLTAASVDLAVLMDEYYFVGIEYRETESAEPQDLNKNSVLKKTEDGHRTLGDITIANGSHIYVNYAPKGSGGYVPPSPPPAEMPEAPETTKTVTDNGDGTYTIQLDVIGHQDENVTQIGANVIVVMDITQSMTNQMPDGSGSRMAAAKRALSALVTTLDPDTNLINFTAMNFGVSQNGATLARDWTTQTSQMTAYVNGLPNNPNEYGTNWKAGLLGGRSRVENAASSSTLSKNETYVIFVTDGNPNCYTDNNGGWHGSTGPNFNQQAYNAAVATANWLGANSHFYGVFVGDDAGYDHLDDLISGAHGEAVIDGSTSSGIEAAFADIAQTIVDNLSAGNTVVDDGVPSLANVSANVSAGEAGGFEYYITPKNGTQTEWAEAPGASYDQSNGVTWDLGEAGDLQDGYTYTLKFKVWPSQEAYDLIADLNNGLKNYNDLPEAQKDAVTGSKEAGYTLKTNTHLYTTFTDSAGNEYRETNDASSKAMNLPTETISVEKIWNNYIDQRNPPAGVSLIVTKDGADYLAGDTAVEVSASTGWKSGDIYISMGQIVKDSDNSYEILEKGHEYQVVEPAEGLDFYWELTSEVYRPMVINGVATVLIKDDEAEGTDGVDYYTIEGNKYKVSSGENTLKAWNDRRGFLQIEKQVTGTGAPADALFEFTVTITDVNGDDIWYSAFDSGTIVKDLETNGTAEDGDTGYFHAASGSAITVKIEAGWTLRFINLPSGSTYEVEETTLPDGFTFESAAGRIVKEADESVYKEEPETPEVSGMTASGEINVPNTEFYIDYTNKYEETSITVKKLWKDSNNAAQMRPTTTEFADDIQLLVNGEVSDAYDDNRTITDNGDGTFTIKYTKLPKYIDNEEATFEVQEATVPAGYEIVGEDTAEDGGEITNEMLLIEKKVIKKWDDNDNQDGKRPASLTVTLSDGTSAVATRTLSVSNDWSATVQNLPKKDAEGNEITYTWTEDESSLPEGYELESSVEEDDVTTITNTYTPETTQVTVTKIWNDDDDRDGKRSNVNATVLLYKTVNGTKTAVGDSVAVPATDGDVKVWEDLPVYEGGKQITYSVEETLPSGSGYSKSGDDKTLPAVKDDSGTIEITNSYTPEKTSSTVKKIWNDANNQDGQRPAELTVTLNDDDQTQKTLNAGNNWTATVTGLPKYADGAEIEYKWTEDESALPDGYAQESSVTENNVTTITNVYTPKKTTVTVIKVWDDNDDEEGMRPDSITVQLKKNGSASGSAVTLDESGGWTYTWEELDVYADGKEITYTVDEPNVPTGYKKEVGEMSGDADSGFTVEITNTHTPERITINVKKVWKDANNKDKIRPSSVQVKLLADGDVQETVTLDESNSWKYTWEDLPKRAGGNEIKYTVEEVTTDVITGKDGEKTYAYSVTGNVSAGFTVTNTHTPKKDNPPTPPRPPVVPNTADAGLPESPNLLMFITGMLTLLACSWVYLKMHVKADR